MGYGLLNIGSLLLGLIACMLPIINLAKRNKTENKNWSIFSIASVSACAISMLMQIFYQDHLVEIEDWSALMDTSGGVVRLSTILLVITLALNVITMVKYRVQKSHQK